MTDFVINAKLPMSTEAHSTTGAVLHRIEGPSFFPRETTCREHEKEKESEAIKCNVRLVMGQ